MQNYKLFVFDHIDRKPHSNQISNIKYLKVHTVERLSVSNSR